MELHIKTSIKQQKLINSKMYTNAHAYWNNSKVFVNFLTNYVICKINPSNETFVKETINNEGYDTCVIIKDISINKKKKVI